MLYVSEKGPYDQFLLFGDSIIQQSASQERGFAFMPALQDAYIRRLDVINRGFSGYNTAQAVKALPEFMPSPTQARLRFMIVFFGANDACLPSSSTGQHIPLSQYRNNLKRILRHQLVRDQQPRLIMVTPPPVDEYQLEETQLQKGTVEIQRTAEHTKLYADACREVGNELDVVVLDLWSVFMAETGWRKGELLPGSKGVARSQVLQHLLHDGLHLNPAGYKILYEETRKIIHNVWSEQAGNILSVCLPNYDKAPE